MTLYLRPTCMPGSRAAPSLPRSMDSHLPEARRGISRGEILIEGLGADTHNGNLAPRRVSFSLILAYLHWLCHYCDLWDHC